MPFLRSLTPVESLGEILFGLIMVLTVTLGYGIAARSHGAVDTAELLYAAIGCNVAWAVIDAAFYIMSSAFIRGRRARLIRAITSASDQQSALESIKRELEAELEPLTRTEDRDQLYRSIFQLISHAAPRPNKITMSDLSGAFATFILVSVTALPAAVPFLLVKDPWLALRLSNLLLIGLLFVVGYFWAAHTEANPWLAGACVTLLGVALVAIAIPLGG